MSLVTAGVYGDVIRVKILYNKKDNALLQYSEPTQAQLGKTQLIDKYEWAIMTWLIQRSAVTVVVISEKIFLTFIIVIKH